MVQVPVQVQRQKKSNVLAQRQAKKEKEGELANSFLPAYSSQGFNGLDEVHPHWEKQSVQSPSPIVISSKNTQNNKQVSGHSMVSQDDT